MPQGDVLLSSFFFGIFCMPEFTEKNNFIKKISINGLYFLANKYLNNSNKIPIKSELYSPSDFPSKIISLKHN